MYDFNRAGRLRWVCADAPPLPSAADAAACLAGRSSMEPLVQLFTATLSPVLDQRRAGECTSILPPAGSSGFEPFAFALPHAEPH